VASVMAERRALPRVSAKSKPLPPRQQQVLALLLEGLSEKQVARSLALSIHTVHVYIKRLYRALAVSSRGEMFAAILRGRSTPTPTFAQAVAGARMVPPFKVMENHERSSPMVDHDLIEFPISPRARMAFSALREKLGVDNARIAGSLIDWFAGLDANKQQQILTTPNAQKNCGGLPHVAPFSEHD
jgi:DNA-binding CsgD family transcriptional regulator